MSNASENALILHPHAKSEIIDLGSKSAIVVHLNDPGFITHLIATRDQVPQTRRKRQAAPNEGAAAYRISGTIDMPIEPPRVKRSI